MFYTDSETGLVFIGSQYIKAFPCGRRKSEIAGENRYIPIDPEARLNTEANNRKHSGLNGYKQSYLRHWDIIGQDSNISLVLAGYLFDIELLGIDSINAFASEISKSNGDINSIYVNILTTDVSFFSSIDGSNNANSTVGTEILRDQTLSSEPVTCLDLPKDPSKPQKFASDFYFSGLSFSAEPLKQIKESGGNAIPANMHPFSLQILTKGEDGWHICESSRLPEIDHGDTPNSVKIDGSLDINHKRDEDGKIETYGDLTVEGNITANGTLTASDVIIGDLHAVTLEVVTDQNVTNQLQFWTQPKPKNNV